MLTILRFLLLTAAVIFVAIPVNATTTDKTGPSETAAFVVYCIDHFEVCRNEVVDIDNIDMMRQLSGQRTCTYPNTPAKPRTAAISRADSIAATKAILVWLNAHAKTRARNTVDAIEQAKKALWPKECN